ncbi:MAG TPA: alcohol dehydrogenase catalytic domain-containing protein [bacterium]|nr:alcohol dehydrogenase catalytic domain-containing protein [bacterium]
MKALILDGDGRSHIGEVPDPVAGEGEVLVAMRCSGICGSDLVYYHMSSDQLDRMGNRIPCHEPSGVVVDIGTGVTSLQPGDRVSVYHYFSCGKCRECRRGQMQWCAQTRGLGGPIQGSAADLMVVPERNAMKLPDSLSFVDGALIACGAGTSFSAMNKLQPSTRDTLLVLGLGPVGLCGVAMGKALGARVVAVGKRQPRLQLASLFGADVVIDIAQTENVPKAIREACKAPTLVYETSSAPQARQWAVDTCARGGKICTVAGRGEPGWPAGPIVGKEITLQGSFVLPVWMVFDLIKFLVEKDLKLDRMVTHRFPIDRADEALALFETKECGKVVIEWE